MRHSVRGVLVQNILAVQLKKIIDEKKCFLKLYYMSAFF